MSVSDVVIDDQLAVRSRRGLRAAVLAGVVLMAGVLAACGERAGGAPQAGPGGGAPPPPAVGVVTATPRAIGLTTELPGRVEASRSAQVRARVAGIVQKRLFVEGSEVKAGQPLFRIDASAYEATLASAQATLARAQANLSQASAQAERFKPLLEANAISKQDYVNAVAAQKTAEADVAAARAAIRSSQINLGYASVNAPIAGRIGRALVTEGALVGQGEATPLAVIQQIDPVYVNFTQSSTELLRLRRDVEAGRFKRASGPDSAQVQIVLDDGSAYPQPGKLLFTDLSVDPTSGQVTLRAEVPNPRGFLLPGMYVRVRLEQVEASNGIAVPQQSVQRGSSGDTVMVVSPEGKVAPRPVKIGATVDGQAVVLEGLKAGETVMVDGFQKLRGDAPVRPVPWQPLTGALPGAAAASGAAGASPASGASAASAASAPARGASAR